MASVENDETTLDNETGGSPQLQDFTLFPRQEEDHALQSLVPIFNQETDIVASDVQPEGFVLLPPPEHEPIPSREDMTTLNQESPLVWTESRKPPEYFYPPRSSLPPRRYISPREHNPAARPPTAMAHRAHTPLPQFANARSPDATPMLTEYKQHGLTTYSHESTEEIYLDPDARDDRDVLRYTDKVPMAGKYLQTAEYREGMRAQENMLEEYSERDMLDAQNAVDMQRDALRMPWR
jgi:hypothetical protein